jgi:hypothetical protein
VFGTPNGVCFSPRIEFGVRRPPRDQTITTPLGDYVVQRLHDVADLTSETTDNRPTGKEAAQ